VHPERRTCAKATVQLFGRDGARDEIAGLSGDLKCGVNDDNRVFWVFDADLIELSG
jgi:hypothetical protein